MTSCYDEGSLSQQGSIKRFLLTAIRHSTVSGGNNQMMFSTNTVQTSRKKERQGINIDFDYFVSKSAPLDLSTEAFPFETNQTKATDLIVAVPLCNKRTLQCVFSQFLST